MTKRGKKWIRAIPVIFSLLILLVLTGCVSMSVEDLYALPELSCQPTIISLEPSPFMSA